MVARTFNGSTQRINCPAPSSVNNISTGITIGVWVRVINRADWKTLVTKQRSPSTYTGSWSLYLPNQPTDLQMLVRWTTARDHWINITGLTLTNWHLVVWNSGRSAAGNTAVYDTNLNEIAFASSSATVPGASDTIDMTTNPIILGTNSSYFGWANCEIGPYAVWDGVSAFGPKSSGALRPAVAYLTRGRCSITPAWAMWPRGANEYDLTLNSVTAATEVSSPGVALGPFAARHPFRRVFANPVDIVAAPAVIQPVPFMGANF